MHAEAHIVRASAKIIHHLWLRWYAAAYNT